MGKYFIIEINNVSPWDRMLIPHECGQLTLCAYGKQMNVTLFSFPSPRKRIFPKFLFLNAFHKPFMIFLFTTLRLLIVRFFLNIYNQPRENQNEAE